MQSQQQQHVVMAQQGQPPVVMAQPFAVAPPVAFPEAGTSRTVALVMGAMQMFLVLALVCTQWSTQGFWYYYIVGTVVMVLTFMDALFLLTRTSSNESTFSSGCCCSASGAFSNLRILHILNGVFCLVDACLGINQIVQLAAWRDDRDAATEQWSITLLNFWIMMTIIAVVILFLLFFINMAAIPVLGNLHVKVSNFLQVQQQMILENQATVAAAQSNPMQSVGGMMIQQPQHETMGAVQHTYPAQGVSHEPYPGVVSTPQKEQPSEWGSTAHQA